MTAITGCSEPKASGTFTDGSTVQYFVSATVSLGSEAGLLPGMILHAQAPQRGSGEVVEVEPLRATVEFRFARYDAERDTPRPGWSLSTRSSTSGARASRR